MRKRFRMAIAAIVLLFLSGCVAETYAVTEEEQNIIAEYAAGVLLRNDEYYLEALVTPTPTPSPTWTPTPPKPDGSEGPEDTPTPSPGFSQTPDPSGSGNEEEIKQNATISEVYGISGIEVKYANFSILESYSEPGNKQYMVKATSGKKLVKVDLTLTNMGSGAKKINFGSFGVKYRLDYNGKGFIGPMITVISNDLFSGELSKLEKEIAAGESMAYCLFFQIGEDGMSNGRLILSKNESTSIIALD